MKCSTLLENKGLVANFFCPKREEYNSQSLKICPIMLQQNRQLCFTFWDKLNGAPSSFKIAKKLIGGKNCWLYLTEKLFEAHRIYIYYIRLHRIISLAKIVSFDFLGLVSGVSESFCIITKLHVIIHHRVKPLNKNLCDNEVFVVIKAYIQCYKWNTLNLTRDISPNEINYST